MNNILISLAASLGINLLGMYINYRCFLQRNYLKWSFKVMGGECMSETGFGLSVFHTYGMSPEETDGHNLSFSPVNFIIFTAFTALLIYGGLFLWHKFRHNP
ncbi:hypothetical protein IJT93_07035 [bacterium]|nr:hypothetical protein [bacterium]